MEETLQSNGRNPMPLVADTLFFYILMYSDNLLSEKQ
jgi:hypothetical protein